MQGVTRVVDEFKRGAETLSPLQQEIRGVSDEYRGLIDTLTSLNYGSLAEGLDTAAIAKINKIIKGYTDQLNQSLEERLNVANGKTFLNDASAVLRQHLADIAAAAELGSDPAV